MKDKIYKTMERFRMLAPGDHVLVAFSGGPDSSALLHFLWSDRERLGIQVSAAHLNHAWRGVESDRDEARAKEFCERYGIPFYVERLPDDFWKKEGEGGFETRAREIRYAFLQRVATEIRAIKIALGHNGDDNVETFLMSLMRGAGLEGLSGIPPVRDNLIRPLIQVSRAEILEYCAEHHLEPCWDRTNLELKTLRNWVRHKLLPQMEEQTPGVRERIAQTSDVVREEIEMTEKISDDYRARAQLARYPDRFVFSHSLFVSLPRALQRRLFRNSVRALGCSLQDVGFRHTDEVIEGIQNGASFSRDLPMGIRVEKSDRTIAIIRRGN